MSPKQQEMWQRLSTFATCLGRKNHYSVLFWFLISDDKLLLANNKHVIGAAKKCQCYENLEWCWSISSRAVKSKQSTQPISLNEAFTLSNALILLAFSTFGREWKFNGEIRWQCEYGYMENYGRVKARRRQQSYTIVYNKLIMINIVTNVYGTLLICTLHYISYIL